MKDWMGYIVITLIFVILSTQFQYFNMQYQRELFLGKGEIPWAGIGFVISLLLYHIYTKKY